MNKTSKELNSHYDVVILGAGLAGLTLARHLLLETDKTVLLLEKRSEIPSRRQKVGESSVQLAGYYFSRVLDLEEYLWRNHYMKYNLRFYWKTPGQENSRFEEYSQGYIRNFSNIPSYQLDRNTFEAELLRRNLESARFTCLAPVKVLEATLSETGPHAVRFIQDDEEVSVSSHWLVDTSGRGKFLARRKEMERRSPIHHGAFWWWVDGLVDVDRLTDLSAKEIRKKRQRQAQGHLPTWLATNHFCDEGLWFWVIPLQGKTSLGLVFDKAVIDHRDVFSVEKATRWVCEKFPCFARDLPEREVLDYGGLADYAHDCTQTINPARWAMAGEAGRFTDPLYSPGSDLIAIHNTLIVDAIQTEDGEDLAGKCNLYEQMMRAVYQAYVPSYANSYDVLGDQETFSLKYTWELTIYFAGYVFPFINDLFTERRFLLGFFRLFSRLGPINQTIQSFLSGYYQWKKETGRGPSSEPILFDFTEIGTLREAEKTFYRVDISVEEAKEVFARQVSNLEELARFIAVYIASRVVGDERVLTNRRFVQGTDIYDLSFDPVAMGERWARCASHPEVHPWSFDPHVLASFREHESAPVAHEVSA